MSAAVDVTLVLWHPDWRVVGWTLDSLAAQRSPVRLHVFANDDPDGTVVARVLVCAQASDVAIESTHSDARNIGFAGAHNVLLDAVFAGDATAAVVLNPDVGLEPDALATLTGFRPAQDVPWLAGPLLELAAPDTLDAEGVIDTAGIRWTRGARHLDTLQGEPVSAAPSRPRRVDGISGACLLVTRAAYERIVGATGEFFDNDFIAYREDAELALRAAALGVESWLVPAARGLHVRTSRGTSRGVSQTIDRLGVRNRFLIAFKHGRHRPGGHFGAIVRDVIVVLGVLVRERSSLSGLREAWSLRRPMRAKGQRMREAARSI
jgi:GT2 family glycosyltransferase